MLIKGSKVQFFLKVQNMTVTFMILLSVQDKVLMQW